MEKYIFVVLTVIFSVFSLSVVAAQKLPPVVEECILAEKATDDDFKNLKLNTQPRTKTMKCLSACIGEKSGKIVNNKLNSQQVLTSIKTLPDYSEQLQQIVSEVLTECSNVQDPDRCEFSSKLADCLIAGATKSGISFHTFYAL